MNGNNITNGIDFSPVAKFMSEAVKMAYEQGRLSENDSSYLDLNDFEVNDDTGILLYEEDRSICLKKFFSEKGSEYNKSICNGYHKIFVQNEGNFSINTDDDMIILDKDRKFYYIKDGKSFDLSFFDDCWFYVLLIPSQP